MAPQLLALPNEILNEIIQHLIPEFDEADGGDFSYHKEWRESPHHGDLRNLGLTCKHFYDLTRPPLYNTVVVAYHTNMTFLLRTLIEHPEVRRLIRTLSIQCPLTYCDLLINPYSPRETFLDDNPELERKLNMKWDTDTMDDYAAKVFAAAGLDRDEFKEFTESETEALNDNTYWMSVPDWSERAGYENALIQGIALALIGLSTNVERLCMWRYREKGRFLNFKCAIDAFVKDEELNDKVLASLMRLDFRADTGWDTGDYLTHLRDIPAVKKLMENGVHVKAAEEEFWTAKI